MLSSSVVTNPRVPRVVRHSLNLESGMNDGLALPAVLAFTAAAVGEDDFVWWKFVLQDVTLGFAFGLAMGLLAALLMPRGRGLEQCIPDHQKSLYALGVAFATYGVTVLPPEGNGLIAVFTCAIVFGIRRPDLRESFEARAADIVEIVKLGIFVVFGALLTLDGLFGDGWAAVALVAVTLLVARPVAIWISLAGTRLSTAVKAFMAWFGPKGVATMTFSLLVLAADFAEAGRVFNLAALCVFVSILAHGLTDTPGSEWIARQRLSVKRGLLLSGRERPRGLAPALLAEHEAQLARRPQPLRMVRPERRARLVECECAQTVAPEEAILATHLPDLRLPRCHCSPEPQFTTPSQDGAYKSARAASQATDDSRKTHGLPHKYPRTVGKARCLRYRDPASWAVFGRRP